MANKNNERNAARERVEAVLVGSKRFPVEIVAKQNVMTRNEKGHITGVKTVYTLAGHGVSNPFKRTYFRDTRVEKLVAEGLNVTMPRVKRGSGQVIVELAA